MKVCEYWRSRSFLYHIFSRFCMFCALLGQDIRWAFTGPLVLWFKPYSMKYRQIVSHLVGNFVLKHAWTSLPLRIWNPAYISLSSVMRKHVLLQKQWRPEWGSNPLPWCVCWLFQFGGGNGSCWAEWWWFHRIWYIRFHWQ